MNLFYPQLQAYFVKVLRESSETDPSRIIILDKLVDLLKEKYLSDSEIMLTFICTHNSRRSHFGQIWAQVAASYFKIPKFASYSGGTEATAFNPRAVAAIKRAGLKVSDTNGTNPKYEISYGDHFPKMICFSKTFDHKVNPDQNFMAIMTCSEADENCPLIVGAETRIPLLYDDPKSADNTAEEISRYDERCLQIASELFYVFGKIR